MRVLIASFYFPPSNVIGAVRVGKMAKPSVVDAESAGGIAVRWPTVGSA